MRFTKNDLKPGMLCELRSGCVCVAIPRKSGEIALWNGERHCKINTADMAEDMACLNGIRDYDVMRVYDLSEKGNPLDEHNRELLWERKEAKRLTVSQIEERLGYPVEIVKEEE